MTTHNPDRREPATTVNQLLRDPLDRPAPKLILCYLRAYSLNLALALAVLFLCAQLVRLEHSIQQYAAARKLYLARLADVTRRHQTSAIGQLPRIDHSQGQDNP